VQFRAVIPAWLSADIKGSSFSVSSTLRPDLADQILIVP